jgi:hypothetical protein
LDPILRGFLIHLGSQVAQQEDVLAPSLRPAFERCHVCINDEQVKQIGLPARLEDALFDQRFWLTLHPCLHNVQHRIRNRATMGWRMSRTFLDSPCLHRIS